MGTCSANRRHGGFGRALSKLLPYGPQLRVIPAAELHHVRRQAPNGTELRHPTGAKVAAATTRAQVHCGLLERDLGIVLRGRRARKGPERYDRVATSSAAQTSSSLTSAREQTRLLEPYRPQTRQTDIPPNREVDTLCPVCNSGMTSSGQCFTARWHGRVVRFLSTRCKRSFKRRRDGEGLCGLSTECGRARM